MSTDKKYLVVPGTVFSQTDGQRHYVDGAAIMSLYGVAREVCIIKKSDIPERAYPSELIRLRPDWTGRYKLPMK